ncbi:MAG: gliding motility-associated C-terminal domain-containing protein [Sphingobacteriaceae bacterium]|nr:gliding motility-associated C-terminal domain-containing protein [Sphingobacteriaceae bacterium]
MIWNYGDKPFEQMGATTNYCYEKSGTYNVRLTVNDSNNCKSAFTYSNIVQVFAKPVVGFITNPEIITLNNSSDVEIINTTLGGKTFKWEVSGLDYGITQDIKYTFLDTGCVSFKLMALSDQNCADTLMKNICVVEAFNVWIPSSFTPNGDGLNDEFKWQGTGFSENDYLFEVYNRWGVRLFRTQDINIGWDGKFKGSGIESGQYLWYINMKDNQQVTHKMKGFVEVLR